MTEATLTESRAEGASPASGQGFPVWYELMTPDPGAVTAFYRATLGWEIEPDGQTMPNGSEYRMIKRTDGGNAGGVLTMSPAMQAGGARPGWLTYFSVADVDAATAQAQQLGGAVHMPPTTMGEVGRMAMLADPQGAPFYLMKPTPPADKPDAQSDVFQPNAPGHSWWNELETTDEPAASAFYTALFGWQADKTMPMGDKGVYRFIEQDQKPLGAINPWMPDWTGVAWLPYFGVARIDEARAAAEKAGGTIRHDIHEVPGGDFIFTLTDPAGAPLGIVGKRGA
jgi:uncharacterized protein